VFLSRRVDSQDGERGFSLILALVVLSATTVLMFAGIDAVLGNVQTTRTNLDQKRALLAAQAGVSAYEQQINNNPNYWTTCPGADGATGVTSTTGQTGVTVPGSSDDGSVETYAYANVPATGTTYTGCSTVNPIASTIEGTTGAAGTFRVRVKGTSKAASGTGVAPINRTLIAQFHANSFLNYVYFTNYEEEDPEYAVVPSGEPGAGGPESNCVHYAWGTDPRNDALCQEIPFQGAGDSINGPMHSNDDVLCNSSGTSVNFGRAGESPPDVIQTPNTLAPNSDSTQNCTGTVTNGVAETLANGLFQTLQLPADDTQLQAVADGGNASLGTNSNPALDCSTTAGCVFDGPTTIILDGPDSTGQNYMTVKNGGVTTAPIKTPANGVIYVNQSPTTPCTNTYSPYGSENQLYGGTTLDTNSGDTANAGCGDAIVEANTSASSCPGATQVSGVCPYTTALTISAFNDIIIASNLTTTSTTSSTACSGESGGCPTGTAVLGLITNHMIRVFHPLTGARPQPGAEYSCPSSGNTNGTGSLVNPVIDAAIFSVEDSFIIDNYDCGGTSGTTTALGNLNVNGAIIQDFRGRIGESVGTASNYTGYIKDYWYDQRLQTISPPYFLNPVDAGWEISRITECDASSC
jgi:Tfp pilus assembly protein PilX